MDENTTSPYFGAQHAPQVVSHEEPRQRAASWSRNVQRTKVVANPKAEAFCAAFLRAPPRNRLLFGTNPYATGIATAIDVHAFVDDYTEDTSFFGKPVIKSAAITADDLVVATLLGKPRTGRNHLDRIGANHLDYFAFHEAAGLALPHIRFWGLFGAEFRRNKAKYAWIESLLHDDESRRTFSNLLSFRLSGNLDYMSSYADRESVQYFEPFLAFAPSGEVFVDVGGFDGYTSEEFIKKCPGYQAVLMFEPDRVNFTVAQQRLAPYAGVTLLNMGLSDRRQTLRFASDGSVSAITDDGGVAVEVDTLDTLIKDAPTLIKMDIEGAEAAAIDGARETIAKHHPRLAICVYHRAADFWRIPEQILAIRDDYTIYLRHYTEGVSETVMFFIPTATIS